MVIAAGAATATGARAGAMTPAWATANRATRAIMDFILAGLVCGRLADTSKQDTSMTDEFLPSQLSLYIPIREE